MKRLMISRWLDRTGLTLLALALLLYLVQDKVTPSSTVPITGGVNYGAAGTDFIIILMQSCFASLGALLLLGRPLLRLRWWYSWIGFAAVGGSLLFVVYRQRAITLEPWKRMSAELALGLDLVGFACILMAWIFFSAQLAVRQAERATLSE